MLLVFDNLGVMTFANTDINRRKKRGPRTEPEGTHVHNKHYSAG